MNMSHYRISITQALLFSLTLSVAYGQKRESPADKYQNAYKPYLDAPCPLPDDGIKHFVYFAKDREAIKNHALLTASRLTGAQIMYSWKDLEPEKGRYEFSRIREDYEYLEKHGKKLFVQLQDATFSPQFKAVPDYLLTKEYDGGITPQFNDREEEEGWVAKRWNAKVRERFALLLDAFGNEFDGKIEGVNLQETAIGVRRKSDPGFSEEKYVAGLKANMLALKKAFPRSATMQYANFIPGEWLPWEDKGYLKGLYRYGEEIGVGLGGPDLMVNRKAQLNHSLGLMHEGKFTVPLGIAIQDGNYIGKTGADADYNEHAAPASGARKNIVPMLHGFAKDFLKVSYMFWVNQEPYFTEDVLPCLHK